jgi:GNAT superfamily N-acetyltransferase|tara:strand:+ start:407 stop:871 length:465 start_codon:yes stop_codon:yes gene_type:complete
MQVITLTFEQIKEIWEKELWPNRESAIETHSAMTWPLTNTVPYDMEIFEYIPAFYAIEIDNKIVGVNSGHRTEDKGYRSRGLWVHPDFRRKGVGNLLLKILCEEAFNRDCEWIWSIPRKSALSTYKKSGFTTVGDFFDEGMEYGPNIYVYKDLD